MFFKGNITLAYSATHTFVYVNTYKHLSKRRWHKNYILTKYMRHVNSKSACSSIKVCWLGCVYFIPPGNFYKQYFASTHQIQFIFQYFSGSELYRLLPTYKYTYLCLCAELVSYFFVCYFFAVEKWNLSHCQKNFWWRILFLLFFSESMNIYLQNI